MRVHYGHGSCKGIYWGGRHMNEESVTVVRNRTCGKFVRSATYRVELPKRWENFKTIVRHWSWPFRKPVLEHLICLQQNGRWKLGSWNCSIIPGSHHWGEGEVGTSGCRGLFYQSITNWIWHIFLGNIMSQGRFKRFPSEYFCTWWKVREGIYMDI